MAFTDLARDYASDPARRPMQLNTLPYFGTNAAVQELPAANDGYTEVDSSLKLVPGGTYRATMRVKRKWRAEYSGLIRTGVRTYDFLNEKVKVTNIAFNFHTEITNADFFDVIVTFQTSTVPEVKEAGLSGAAIGAIIAGALFLVVLASGSLVKFEQATGAVSTTAKAIFNPGTLILAVVALFLVLKYGRG